MSGAEKLPTFDFKGAMERVRASLAHFPETGTPVPVSTIGKQIAFEGHLLGAWRALGRDVVTLRSMGARMWAEERNPVKLNPRWEHRWVIDGDFVQIAQIYTSDLNEKPELYLPGIGCPFDPDLFPKVAKVSAPPGFGYREYAFYQQMVERGLC